MKIAVFLLLSIAGMVLRAQPEAVAGRVLFVIRPEFEQAFTDAFAPAVDPENKQFDAQKVRLESGISQLIGLPSSITNVVLRPFAPQHSVVLPDLRQRMNPILWMRFSQGVRIVETEAIARLRAAESRIARTFELIFEGDQATVITALKKSGMAETVEPRYRRTPQYIPNDSLLGQQWALSTNGINAIKAWDIVKGDPSLVIAVVDVGTDWEHPDLIDAIYINTGETGTDNEGYDKRANAIDDDGNGFVDDWHGWDFAGTTGISPDNNPTAFANHGTHTGGIMAASGDNKRGVAGVAYGSKLLPLKGGDESGGSIEFGFDAMIYAADMGALAVNNSWGGTTRSEIEQDIVDYVAAKNCVVVAASGNRGLYEDFFPASYRGVLSVASSDANGSLSSFSNFGTRLDVSAPGNGVLSTVQSYWGSYSALIGTSMASPHAAGAIALVRKRFPEYDGLQAAERLRATSDAIAVEENRKDLSGRGRINLFRAVSIDSIAYSARIEKFELFDENTNRILEPGESGAIVLSVRNYLAPLDNLRARIEFVEGGTHVTKTTSLLEFGPANTLELVKNLQAAFGVTASPSTPPNTRVLVKVIFFDEGKGYINDVDYFSLIVNPAYQDLNANNLLVTIDSKGDIGYNDPPTNYQGSGFQWRQAPPSISAKGRSVLWQAGIMAGIDEEHVSAASPGPYEASAEQDWRIEQTVRYVAEPTHIRAAQELYTVYNDDHYDTATQVGLKVSQRSYAFTAGLSANAVVLDYLFSKRPTATGTQPNDETSIALFMDWDIGLSGSNNRAYFDAEHATAITDRLEPGYPVVGIKILSDIPTGAKLQYYAINNDGSDGSLMTYNGYEDWEKWLSMTQTRLTAGPGDVSTVFGLRNVPFGTPDTMRVTFAIALATDLAALRQTMSETEKEWKTTSAVRNDALARGKVFIYPNPSRDHFTLVWSAGASEFATIEVVDLLGREVYHTRVQGGEFDVRDHHLMPGTYLVRITTENAVYQDQLILLP